MAIVQSKVHIDPSSNIIYSSYYIKGLFDLYGKKNVVFSTKYFTGLNKRKDDYSFDAYMAFVIVKKEDMKKVIIDFGDDYPIRENAYNWCDIYAKINYNPELTLAEFKDKIHSIPPGFAIKIWNLSEILYYSVSNLLKLKFSPQISFINHFRFYLNQIKLLRVEHVLQDTKEVSVLGNYVFFIASLWPHANCIIGTNKYRKMFIDTCQMGGITFEGGFWVSDTNHPQFTAFKELIFNKRYSLKDFIEKTKKSRFVFNTPAVHNCHGWKLGQYLAMNKAIISTPFQNVLLEDLVHGENIHFVEDEQEVKAAIEKLINNEIYQKNLEKGARKYYEKHAAPLAVIKGICQKLKLPSSYDQ